MIINNITVNHQGYYHDTYLQRPETFHFNSEHSQYKLSSNNSSEGSMKVAFEIVGNPFLTHCEKYPARNEFPLDLLHISKEFSDITINVFKESEKFAEGTTLDRKGNMVAYKGEKKAAFSTFIAHKCIISAASPFFRRLLTINMKESQQDTFSLYEVDPVLFEKVLRFCYLYNIDITNYKEGCALLKLNDYLEVRKLNDIITKRLFLLMDNSNVWYIWETALKYSAILEETCQGFLACASDDVFNDESWLVMPAEVVKSALNHQYVKNVSEETIYRAVARWIKHQRSIIEEPITDKKSKSRIAATYMDEKNLERDAGDIMKLIEFQTIPSPIISQEIYSDKYIMDLPGIKDLILDAFVYKTNQLSLS